MFNRSNRLALYPVIAGCALIMFFSNRQSDLDVRSSVGLRPVEPLKLQATMTLQTVAWTQIATDKSDAPSDSSSEPAELTRQPLDGAVIRIPLPITGQVDMQVRRQIERTIQRLPTVNDSALRPVLVLEFDLDSGASGEGSEVERCIALARYLTSPELNRVRTVAYIPASQTRFDDLDSLNGEPVLSELRGHAVLVALSCEQIVMDEDTAIGAAGIDEPVIDNFLRESYRSNTQRRRVFPEPLVMSLLDKQQALYRVTTDAGVVFADSKALEKLEADGKAVSSETVSDPGLFPQLTSETLLEYRLIRSRVASRQELADRLGVRREVLLGDPTSQGDWKPLHIKLRGPIHKREVDWILNALSKEVTLAGVNLLIFEIDSPGGESIQCLRLAERIAEFDSLEVQSVAFVSGEARGATVLPALACDHLIMAPDALIGGPGEFRWRGRPDLPGPDQDIDAGADADQAEDEALLRSIKQLAPRTGVSWSLMAAIVDPSITVNRMKHRKIGRVAIFTDEELQSQEDPSQWADLGEIKTSGGLTGSRADELRLTRQLAAGFDEVKTFYQLTEDPPLLEPTVTDKWIQRLGKYLSSPMISGWLLFGSMFFFMVEMSNPGIGVPGFIATIFCMLFFWSQYCDGNANWLEILMFVVGLVFVGIEVFLVPGIGIFGIGGGLLLVASIVLATQDFLWPRTAEELSRLPASLSMILFAGGGIIVSGIVIRTFLPHIPFLNKMVLDPPGSDDDLETLSSREALTHFEYLVGKRGFATTPLLPSGKAEIGDEIHNVITDGRVIERGQAIVVRQVVGNRIEVAPD